MSMAEGERKQTIDETRLINRLMPKRWKCPHCGRQNKTGPMGDEILLEHFKYLEHCGCGYVHFWTLELTDDFKKKVVGILRSGLRKEREQ